MKPEEPVVFVRLFMFTAGIVTVLSGLGAALITVRRALSAPGTVQVNRSMVVFLSLLFLLGYLLSGACWIMAAMSRRIWKSTS